MIIVKTIISTLDLIFMAVALMSALKDKDQSIYKVIAFFELLFVFNIVMMWI